MNRDKACVHMQTLDDEDGCGGGRRDNLVHRAREASTRTSLVSFGSLVHRSHACTIFLGLLCVCCPDHESQLPHLISFVFGRSFMQSLATS